MRLPHGLLENAGDDQSDAMAAGGFSEGKTGGFWSLRCLCMGDARCQLTPMCLPKHHPIPGAAGRCCPVLSVPSLVTDSLISLKSEKQNGAKAVLSVLRDALAASPTRQPTKHARPAPAISPRLGLLLHPACLGPFAGTWVPKSCPGVTAACPKVGSPFAFHIGTVEGWQGALAPRPHPGCVMDFWMAMG